MSTPILIYGVGWLTNREMVNGCSLAQANMPIKASLNARYLNMRCQDIIKVLVISDVSLVSGQGGKQVNHQMIDMFIKGRVVVTTC